MIRSALRLISVGLPVPLSFWSPTLQRRLATSQLVAAGTIYIGVWLNRTYQRQQVEARRRGKQAWQERSRVMEGRTAVNVASGLISGAGIIVEFGEAIKNPAYRIFQTEYSGCLDISAHA